MSNHNCDYMIGAISVLTLHCRVCILLFHNAVEITNIIYNMDLTKSEMKLQRKKWGMSREKISVKHIAKCNACKTVSLIMSS